MTYTFCNNVTINDIEDKAWMAFARKIDKYAKMVNAQDQDWFIEQAYYGNGLAYAIAKVGYDIVVTDAKLRKAVNYYKQNV